MDMNGGSLFFCQNELPRNKQVVRQFTLLSGRIDVKTTSRSVIDGICSVVQRAIMVASTEHRRFNP